VRLNPHQQNLDIPLQLPRNEGEEFLFNDPRQNAPHYLNRILYADPQNIIGNQERGYEDELVELMNKKLHASFKPQGRQVSRFFTPMQFEKYKRQWLIFALGIFSAAAVGTILPMFISQNFDIVNVAGNVTAGRRTKGEEKSKKKIRKQKQEKKLQKQEQKKKVEKEEEEEEVEKEEEEEEEEVEIEEEEEEKEKEEEEENKREKEKLKQEIIRKFNIKEEFVNIFINDEQPIDMKDEKYIKLLILTIVEKNIMLNNMLFIESVI